jgi:hypothetical protein
MERRQFLQALPTAALATVGAVTVGTPVLASPSAPAGDQTPFERLSFETFHIETPNGAMLVEHHIVSTSLEDWLAVTDYFHREDGSAVGWMNATDEDQARALEEGRRVKRRVLFPLASEPLSSSRLDLGSRMLMKDEGSLKDRIHGVAESVMSFGFDTAHPKARPDAWKVIWVEYHCPSRIRHAIAGLPANWDSEAPLAAMVQIQF